MSNKSHASFGVKIWFWCVAQYRELVAAIQFLTILPVPGIAQLFKISEPEPRLIIGGVFFPLVGLLLGGILWLFVVLAAAFCPPLVLAALLVIGLIWLTGGLHLDGLMDSCDGLFGGRDRERKLEIMRDSRVGSFGVLGGGSILLLKFALFASLDPAQLASAFLIILPIARWTMILTIYTFPGARPTGLGTAVRQTITRPRLIVAALLALIIALAFGQVVGLILWLFGSLTALLIGWWVTRELGGLTGDIYGAIAEITEVVCFLMLILWL